LYHQPFLWLIQGIREYRARRIGRIAKLFPPYRADTVQTRQEGQDKQYKKFMSQALVEAQLALDDGEFPVGCVLVLDGDIIGRGHRHNSEGDCGNELDHAEVVTLRGLLAQKPSVDCKGITAYSTMEPCLMCYATMLLSGIRRFVWAYEDIMGGGTSLPLNAVAPLYEEMRVELVPGILRQESLALFYQFFQKYSYWQDSLLEQYTVEQFNKTSHGK